MKYEDIACLSEGARKRAIPNLTDQSLLITIALKDPSGHLRFCAAEALRDQGAITELLKERQIQEYDFDSRLVLH